MRWSNFILVCGLVAHSLSGQLLAAQYEDGYRVFEQILSADSSRYLAQPQKPVSEVLHPLDRIVDRGGSEVLCFSKHVGKIPVYGETSVVIFHSAGRRPVTVRGNVVTRTDLEELIQLSERPPKLTISLERAQQIATQDLRARKEYSSGGVPEDWLSKPEVVLVRDGQQKLRLVHHLALPAKPMGVTSTREYFVDAENGEIVVTFANLYDAVNALAKEELVGTGYGLRSDELKQFPITEAEGTYRLNDVGRSIGIYNAQVDKWSVDPDHVWESIGTNRPDNQRAEVELYLNFQRIVDFYKKRFAFTWGGTVKAVAHAPNPSGGANYDNAYFQPFSRAFFFGDGSATDNGFDYLGKALDVAGHEFGHGFIKEKGPLTYEGESGAICEHIADLLGACVDDDEWLIGDEITMGPSAGKGLRNMQDPAAGQGHLITTGMTYAQWREMNKGRPIGLRIYPDHVSKKIVCTSFDDKGGVHVNSSIFSRFSYLAATGDGLGSEGLGRQLLLDIYVRAMNDRLYSQRASFKEFRDALMAAADLQLQGHEKRDAYLKTLQKSFAAIGL